jgi:RHS repeat-associated protein
MNSCGQADNRFFGLQKFTGKERDAESGLDYFGARYYGGALGRFTSPDWNGKPEPVPYAKLDNPQTLNQYAYVLNSPLGKADSDGHCPWCLALAGGGALAEESPLAFAGPPGWAVIGATAIGVAAVAIYDHFNSQSSNVVHSEQAAPPPLPTQTAQPDAQSGTAQPTTAATPQPKANPMQGIPGSTSTTTHADGKPKQTREYGDDGHPKTDVDRGHDHGQGDPHAHDWGRPADGSPPTHVDRAPGRPLRPGDPQP